MKKILLIAVLLLPGIVGAASDCRVVELQDRYEAVCTGEGGTPPAAVQPTPAVPAPEPPPLPQLQGAPRPYPETEVVTIQTSRSAGAYRQRKTAQ